MENPASWMDEPALVLLYDLKQLVTLMKFVDLGFPFPCKLVHAVELGGSELFLCLGSPLPVRSILLGVAGCIHQANNPEGRLPGSGAALAELRRLVQ